MIKDKKEIMKISEDTFGRAQLEALLLALRGRRILVFGDVMVDCFIRGVVERISPEAPVPVVSVRSRNNLPGGAANVVRNLLALGACPEIVALVGDDYQGRYLRDELAVRGCGVAGLVVDAGRQTSVKTRIVAHQQQVVRFDEETIEPFAQVSRQQLRRAIIAACADVDGVIISDYGKGVVERELFDLLLAEAHRRKLLIALDPKVANFDIYHDVDLVTPNVVEAGQACGFAVTAENLPAAGARIKERFKSRSVIITRGEDGMAIFPEKSAPLLLPTQAREVFDVTGAGDTVISVLTLALLAQGVSLEQAAMLANLVAGVVVGKTGTATASGAEVLAYHDRLEPHAPRS
ncbi:MAG: bifunctional hydroxymethylpyrimidine kinase/phosphomethylpyrimidine kinase [Deltaproteobacteria bacterium]|nr:bifunctional hydroxymethylpyrimidine kinase/phosphomethylpyrimidine kinase [Deltaproteobacteria bacterium]